VTEAKECDST
jgi:hypothetical protein